MNFFKITLFTIVLFLLSTFPTSSQIISTIAGIGPFIPGYSGSGVLASFSKLNRPSCVTFDASGNYYIADQENDIIQKVSPSGIITTITGHPGAMYDSGDGKPATLAYLNLPRIIVFDAAGNMYIADTYNNKVRMINAKTSIISTVAGNGKFGYTADGGQADTTELYDPYGIAIDKPNNLLYITDAGNNRIREVNLTTGIIQTIAGNGSQGFSGDGGLAINAQFG